MNLDGGPPPGVTLVAVEEVRRSALDTVLPARPFPGLRPFRIDEWPIFFGREVMIEEVIERLLERQVVVVHGSSGCGKSSLVYAGVLPQLARRIGRRRNLLRIAQMRPGQAPLQTMAAALAAACESDDVDGLHRMVAKGAAGAEELRGLIAGRGNERLCLFVDQFEELFRFARQGNAAEAALFADFLTGLARADREDEEEGGPKGRAAAAGFVRLIVTMRSEFLGDCARYPGLAALINQTQYLLPMMNRADLVRAVREPGELFGVEIPHDLAERLVEEAFEESDPLPLMQHALMRLWSEGPEAMTLARYVALAVDAGGECGGRTGLCRLLSAHANEVLDSAAGRDDADAELLFRALTDIDAEGRGIRRPQPLGRLLELVEPPSQEKLRGIVDACRADDASFLRPFENERPSPLGGDEMIDISHEALLRAWPRIADATIDPETGRPRGWLHREIEDGLVWRALAVQARLFETDASAVLDASSTARRLAWHEGFGSRATWAERHLIQRTNVAPEEEPEWLAVQRLMRASLKALARRRLRRKLLWLGLTFLTAAGFALLLYLYVDSRRNLDRANADAAEAEAVAEQQADQARVALAAPVAPVDAPETGMRAETQEPTGTPEPTEAPRLSGSETAFVWVGASGRSVMADARTGAAVAPGAVRAGQIYRTTDWLVARAAMPGQNCAYATGSGFVPRRAVIQILAAPGTCNSGGRVQYWAQARVAIRPFATVFIQFHGGEGADAGEVGAQAVSRQRAGRFADALQQYGYRTPPVDRETGAAGLAEVRYFHRGDREQADMLVYNAGMAARRDPQLAPLGRVRAVDYTRSPRRPPPGTLELWLDLGGGRPGAASPAAG